MKIKVNLNEVEAVKQFCMTASNSTCAGIYLLSGRFVINGRSLLGIFSLDLSKPIDCEIEGTDKEIADFTAKLKELNLLV
jgi:hypothetical protein